MALAIIADFWLTVWISFCLFRLRLPLPIDGTLHDSIIFYFRSRCRFVASGGDHSILSKTDGAFIRTSSHTTTHTKPKSAKHQEQALGVKLFTARTSHPLTHKFWAGIERLKVPIMLDFLVNWTLHKILDGEDSRIFMKQRSADRKDHGLCGRSWHAGSVNLKWTCQILTHSLNSRPFCIIPPFFPKSIR